MEVHVQQEDAAVWKTVAPTGLMCLVALPALAAEPAPKKVEMKGTLRTGIVAIGGETTGTIIETKEGKYEPDFGTDRDLREAFGSRWLTERTGLVSRVVRQTK
jgi:hypothetical protein